MYWLKQNRSILVISLLVLVCLPVVFPLLHKGFFSSDDGEWMIIRFSAFYQAFRDGQFPVRFLGRLNYGYGYPVANFLYPGFMYIGIFIHILGFGFINTIKIVLALSMLLSGVFTYKWLSNRFNVLSAFVGAFVYVYAPYHLYDLYGRGSVGEILALAVVPFILWQLGRKSILWSSLGLAFLMIAHNTLAFMHVGILILYCSLSLYVSNKRRDVGNYFATIFVLGMGMSSFFLVTCYFGVATYQVF